MMTLEEAKQIAREVLDDKTRSHVTAASDLAAFVLSLQSVRPVLRRDEKSSELDH